MPFKSQAQRKWMHANEPAMAREWEKKTPKGAVLPERKQKRKKKPKKGMKAHILAVDENGKLLDPSSVKKAMHDGPLPIMKAEDCACDEKLPLIGKADESLETVPLELKAILSRLPLEVQATELGGAGSTDFRPTMHAANYEQPSRHAGTCAGCDHKRWIFVGQSTALTCSALQGDPAVAPTAHCDLWSGSDHLDRSQKMTLRKAPNGAGPTFPYGEQSMPDYQMIYSIRPKTRKAERKLRDEQDNRRRASAMRNGRVSFHGEPLKPVLRHDRKLWPEHIIKIPQKGQTRPTVQGPVISHDPENPHRRGLRIFRMYGKARGELLMETRYYPQEYHAKRYCEKHPHLMPVYVDEEMAERYGMECDGWVLYDAKAGTFEPLRK